MPEQPWAEGYVVDIGYTHGFYGELAPSLLRFVTLLGGLQSVDADRPFTYYDLGCGNGYTTALLAAANPQGSFIGVDFNPMHVHNAQKRAEEGGVGNVRFLEKSFAELLATELPDAEIIALHGVYSWVNDENRRHIVEFIRRRLKPAGIAYVSYNCLPGLTQVAPLQRLLLAHAGTGGGTLAERIRNALAFAAQLERSEADYFRMNPLAKARLAGFAKRDPQYLAHEYFNASWALHYHADVVRDLAAAKLGYAGSATLIDNFDQLVLKPDLEKLVSGAGDRVMAETIKDFARNQSFRRDVFTRGAPKATPRQLEAMLGQTRFALARPRAACRLSMATAAGEIKLHEEAHAPVLDALARAPMTFDELVQAPATAVFERPRLRQAVFAMAALGNILPALPVEGEGTRRAATDRFNKAVLSRPFASPEPTFLASPVLGSGIPLGFIDRILLSAPADPAAAVDHCWRVVRECGHQLTKDDKRIETESEGREYLAARARLFFNEVLPFLRQLGTIR